MGQTGLILFLILAIVVALFAVQNAGAVMLKFGFWTVETSLVVVILVSAAAGAAMASILGLPGWFRDRRRLKALERQLQALRADQPPTPPSVEAAPPSP